MTQAIARLIRTLVGSYFDPGTELLIDSSSVRTQHSGRCLKLAAVFERADLRYIKICHFMLRNTVTDMQTPL